MRQDHDESPATARADATQALVEQLQTTFREQLHRALETELSADLGESALAYVDHYLSLIRDEEREPIISLLAAGAGAWFGEFVRARVGGQWIGDAKDPRRLRLLLEAQFVHFSPIDMAYEAILATSPEPGDARLPPGAVLDGSFHLRKDSEAREHGDAPEDSEGEGPSDHDWVAERLAQTSPLPEDQYYSLTARFETLTLILELLASRDLARGREPTRYHLNDYVAALTS